MTKQDSNSIESKIILNDTILKNIVKHVKEEVNSYDILDKNTKKANLRINFLEKNGGSDSEKEELAKKIEENRMSLRKIEDDNKAGNLVKVIIEKVFKDDSVNVIGNVRPVKDKSDEIGVRPKEMGVENYIQKMIDRHFYLNKIRNKSIESPFTKKQEGPIRVIR